MLNVKIFAMHGGRMDGQVYVHNSLHRSILHSYGSINLASATSDQTVPSTYKI